MKPNTAFAVWAQAGSAIPLAKHCPNAAQQLPEEVSYQSIFSLACDFH
jgi:hypothetical protein